MSRGDRRAWTPERDGQEKAQRAELEKARAARDASRLAMDELKRATSERHLRRKLRQTKPAKVRTKAQVKGRARSMAAKKTRRRQRQLARR